MDGSAGESAHHAFAAQPTTMHPEDQSQRVVSPTTQQSLAHYQAQYATSYDPYHRTDLEVPTQHHDPRQVQPPLKIRGDQLAWLTHRSRKIGMYGDNRFLFPLPNKEQCTAITPK